jgi:hypothetical protein
MHGVRVDEADGGRVLEEQGKVLSRALPGLDRPIECGALDHVLFSVGVPGAD